MSQVVAQYPRQRCFERTHWFELPSFAVDDFVKPLVRRGDGGYLVLFKERGMGHFSTSRLSFRLGAGEESARRGLLFTRTFAGGRCSSSLLHPGGAIAAVGRAAFRSRRSSTATGRSRSPPGGIRSRPGPAGSRSCS